MLDVKDRVVLALPTRDVVMADVSPIDVESVTVIQIPSLSLDLLIALLSFWAPRRFENHEPAVRLQHVPDDIKECGFLIYRRPFHALTKEIA